MLQMHQVVRVVGSLLKCTTLSWFAPFGEKESQILQEFDRFFRESKASLGNMHSV